MPGGRPPIYNMIEQAKAIEEWSKTDNATALVQFCNLQDIEPSYIYDWRDKSPEFSSALKKAKSRIAERIRKQLHDKQFPYNYGLFMAEIGFHDPFHHDYTEGIKDADAKRKKDIEGAKQSTYNIVVPNDLSVGTNISASPISNPTDKGSE
jgi:hypothetical protein